jgi:hypothetical protein
MLKPVLAGPPTSVAQLSLPNKRTTIVAGDGVVSGSVTWMYSVALPELVWSAVLAHVGVAPPIE